MKYKKTIVTTLAALGLLVAPLTSEAAQFKDVPTNASYKEAVDKLVKFQVLNGYGDGTFKPDTLVTRAQAASIIAKALALDLQHVQAPVFKDVTKENSHYAAIAKLTELGVFSKAEKFNPNSPITRVQMAKMLVVAFELKSDHLQTFTDVEKTSWYYEIVGVLGALQITHSKDKFEPMSLVTRAHFAMFIERVITMKRGDGVADIWDTWGAWDDRGVINPPVTTPIETAPVVEKPTQTTPVNETNTQAKELVQRLKTMIEDVEDAKEDVESVRKDLQKAIEKDKQKTIDTRKKELGEALQLLDQQLMRADDLLEQAAEQSDIEVVKMVDKLQAEMQRAQKVSIESYAETFDKEYYTERFEDVAEDLADAIKDAKKRLDQKSFKQLQTAYQELTKQLQAAESVRMLYKDSNVKTLSALDSDLAKSMKEAEDVLDQTEEWFEERLDDQLDNFKDLFKKALRELDAAVDDGKKGKIYDAKEKVTNIIELAQKVVDDYADLPFDGIQKDLAKLEKEIEDAKKDVRDADK